MAEVTEEPTQSVPISGRRVLKLLEDRLEVEKNKSLLSNKKVLASYSWKDVEKVCVDWRCFSGVLGVKLKNGEQYHFKMSKNLLMHTASAVHRRIGRLTSPVSRAPVDEKVRKLLQNHTDVGVSDNGIMVKRRTGCCTYGIVLTLWSSFVSIRLSRGCRTGEITVHTLVKKNPKRELKDEWSVNGGFKSGGDNLLSDADVDDVEFVNDQAQDTFKIKVGAATSEQLYNAMKTKMSDNFKDMEELPGVFPMKSKYVMGKLTSAGIDVTLYHACAHESKIFTPWDDVVSVAYKHPTCCKQSCIVIEDRADTPILLKGVPFKAFQDIEEVFAGKSVEDAKLKSGQKGSDNLVTTGGSKGLQVLRDGIHNEKSRCCIRNVRTFIPWSKLDGLTMTSSALGRTTLELVTETGNRFRVARTTKRRAWEEFDKFHKAKYGEKPDTVQVFNQGKEDKYCCKLSDQSLLLSLNKGKKIVEVDLDRVISARRAKQTHTQLEVFISMGKLSDVITVPLNGANARQLASDIRGKAEQRKRLLKEAR